jgi:hypothetical protein
MRKETLYPSVTRRIGVEAIEKIRRAYFGLAKPIGEICRGGHVSRRAIRTSDTELRYECKSQRPLKIGPVARAAGGVASNQRGAVRREYLTLIRILEVLGLGYDDNY